MPTARPFTATPPPPGLMPTQGQARKDVQRLLSADKASENYKNLLQDILYRYGSFELFREAAGLDLPGVLNSGRFTQTAAAAPTPPAPGLPAPALDQMGAPGASPMGLPAAPPAAVSSGVPPIGPETLPGSGMPNARLPFDPMAAARAKMAGEGGGLPGFIQGMMGGDQPPVPPPSMAPVGGLPANLAAPGLPGGPQESVGGLPPALALPITPGSGAPISRGNLGRQFDPSQNIQSLLQDLFSGGGGDRMARWPERPPGPPPPPGIPGIMSAGMPEIEDPAMPAFVPPPVPPPGPQLAGPSPGPQAPGGINWDTGRQAPNHEIITRLQAEAMAAQQPQGGGGLAGLATPENLMEFGLRMMAASEAQPGTTVGPSVLGAVGQAGFGTLAGARRRKKETATAAATERRHKETIAVKRETIAANKELRKATLELKAETDAFRNELAAERNRLSKGQLGVSISAEERKATEDLQQSISYMSADPKEQRRAEREVRREFDSIRRTNGVDPLGSGGGAAKGQWVPVK